MKKTVLKLSAIAFVSFLVSCGDTATSEEQTENTAAVAPAEEKVFDDTPKWEYWEDEDKMTDKVRKGARIVSLNEYQFEFPYDGGSIGYIQFQKSGDNLDAIFGISKGQLMTHIDGDFIKVRFDKETPTSYAATSPTDMSSDYLYINKSVDFYKKLLSSKTVIIQAEFFNEGVKTFEFNTEGLTL